MTKPIRRKRKIRKTAARRRWRLTPPRNRLRKRRWRIAGRKLYNSLPPKAARPATAAAPAAAGEEAANLPSTLVLVAGVPAPLDHAEPAADEVREAKADIVAEDVAIEGTNAEVEEDQRQAVESATATEAPDVSTVPPAADTSPPEESSEAAGERLAAANDNLAVAPGTEPVAFGAGTEPTAPEQDAAAPVIRGVAEEEVEPGTPPAGADLEIETSAPPGDVTTDEAAAAGPLPDVVAEQQEAATDNFVIAEEPAELDSPPAGTDLAAETSAPLTDAAPDDAAAAGPVPDAAAEQQAVGPDEPVTAEEHDAEPDTRPDDLVPEAETPPPRADDEPGLVSEAEARQDAHNEAPAEAPSPAEEPGAELPGDRPAAEFPDTVEAPEAADEAAVAPQAEARPGRWGWVATTLSTVCLLGAVGLWADGIGGVNPAGLTDYGIVSILDWQLWAALPLITLGFVLSLRRTSGMLPWLHLLALILLLHGTPAVVYETARYSWTWKHIGIVDFIQRHHWVDPEVRFLNAYHNWPGLFLVTAWIADQLGTGSLELAHAVRFAPPIYNTLFILALYPVYRSFTGDRRLIFTAAWIFIVGNWIGQDYFSPQATAYFFYLLILGLCLGPLRNDLAWVDGATGSMQRKAAAFVRFFSRGAVPPPTTARASTKVLAVLAVLLLTVAITVTHQLTPIGLIVALAALAAIGRISFSYAIIAFVIEICWLLYFATPFVADHIVQELDAFGQGIAAASDRLVDTSVVSPGMVWVVRIGRLTTAAVGLLAVLGFFRRLRAGRHDGAAAVLAGTPIFLFFNSYGGEILFRVYFFALPFLAFFGAALFFPRETSRRQWLVRPILAVLGGLLAIGFMFGNDGKDRQYTFTAAEVEAANWLYSTAPPGTLLIEGSRGYPSQFLNYENFTYVPISSERQAQRDAILKDPVGIFARWLSDPRWKAGYVVITRSQKAYSDAEGVMPRGALDQIEQALLASPRFIVVHATADARIFALHPTVGIMGEWAQ